MHFEKVQADLERVPLRKKCPDHEVYPDVLLDLNAERHYPHLDMTRILCVTFIAIDHGHSSFAKYNPMLVQQWVLQTIYLVCGVCFGLSRRPFHSYLMRLVLYMVVGVALNWFAFMFSGKGVTSAFDVIFQFWFVIGLVLYVICLAPLRLFARKILNAREQQGDVIATNMSFDRGAFIVLIKVILVFGGGVLCTTIIFQTIIIPPLRKHLAKAILEMASETGKGGNYWGFPTDIDGAEQFVQRCCNYFQLSTCSVFIFVVYPLAFDNLAFVAWLVLFNTYANRMVFYRAGDERPWHGFDLTLLGLTCFFYGIKGRKRVGEYMLRYWFIVAIFVYLLWPADLVPIRIDATPPLDVVTRIRVNAIELVFVVFWLTAADRMFSSRIFTEDRLEFLNLWALIVFLVHKACHVLIPSPWNWMFLIALLPSSWWLNLRMKRSG